MNGMKIARVLCIGLAVTMILPLAPALAQPTPADINAKLKQCASFLAKALNQETDLVRGKISASRNKEQIVDLEALVSEALQQSGGESGIWAELETKIGDLHKTLSAGITVAQGPNQPAVNLYFPVREHRRQWDGTTKNLLVAYAPVGDERKVKSVDAYNAETLKAVALDPNIPPDKPTLVIGLAEHESLESSAPLMETAPPVDAAEDPCAVPTTDTNSYIGIPWILLTDDQEPWYKGDPEIYVLVGQVANGRAITHKIYLPGVNDEWKWYYLGDGPGSPLYFYFDNTYGPLTYFQFYEEDWGGGQHLFDVDINGTKCGFTIFDNDDDMGKVYIDRAAVPWVGTRMYSSGYVRFLVDKDL